MMTQRIFAVANLVPCGLLTLALLVCLLCLLGKTCRDKSSHNERSVAEKCFHEIVSFCLGDWIQFRDSDKTYRINIDGADIDECPTVPHGVLILIFIYLVILAEFAILTFSEIFVFSTLLTCDDSSLSFCYLIGDNSIEILQNCTVAPSNVICYRVHLNLFTATGVIGAFFALIKFVISSLNKAAITLYWKYKENTPLFFFSYITILCVVSAALIGFC